MRRRNRRFSHEEEAASAPNPMDGVANMADAMLVLAVGIMLALVINWKVDIGGSGMTNEGVNAQDTAAPPEIQEDVTGEPSETGEGAWQELGSGRVYYDPNTNQYFVIPEE